MTSDEVELIDDTFSLHAKALKDSNSKYIIELRLVMEDEQATPATSTLVMGCGYSKPKDMTVGTASLSIKAPSVKVIQQL